MKVVSFINNLLNVSNLSAQVLDLSVRRTFLQDVYLHVFNKCEHIGVLSFAFNCRFNDFFLLLFNFCDTIFNITYISLLISKRNLPRRKIRHHVLYVVFQAQQLIVKQVEKLTIRDIKLLYVQRLSCFLEPKLSNSRSYRGKVPLNDNSMHFFKILILNGALHTILNLLHSFFDIKRVITFKRHYFIDMASHLLLKLFHLIRAPVTNIVSCKRLILHRVSVPTFKVTYVHIS